jgi:hypothetical protein
MAMLGSVEKPCYKPEVALKKRTGKPAEDSGKPVICKG